MPSQESEETLDWYEIYHDAFTALYYVPTVTWGTVLSKLIVQFSNFNLRDRVMYERCVYSAYRDVMKLYKNFGPIVSVWNELLNPSHPMFDFGRLMTSDIFRYPKSMDDNNEDHMKKKFHNYDLDNMEGRHLSSNIPNFVLLIGLATTLYEMIEYIYTKTKTQIIPIDDEAYILRSNVRQFKKTFELSDKGRPKKDTEEKALINPNDNNYEVSFRQVQRKTMIKNPADFCYLSLQCKIAFIKFKDSRLVGKTEKQTDDGLKWLTIQDLAHELFLQPYNDNHPFYKLDKSFIEIVKYLQNPVNMKEMMLNPMSEFGNLTCYRKASLGEVKNNILKIFGQVEQDSTVAGGTEAGGVGQTAAAAQIETNQQEEYLPRPKPYLFSQSEIQFYKQLVEFHAAKTEVRINKDSPEDVHQVTKLAMLELAEVLCEKMLTVIAITRLHQYCNGKKPLLHTTLENFNSGKLGHLNVFADKATELVPRYYQAMSHSYFKEAAEIIVGAPNASADKEEYQPCEDDGEIEKVLKKKLKDVKRTYVPTEGDYFEHLMKECCKGTGQLNPFFNEAFLKDGFVFHRGTYGDFNSGLSFHTMDITSKVYAAAEKKKAAKATKKNKPTVLEGIIEEDMGKDEEDNESGGSMEEPEGIVFSFLNTTSFTFMGG